VKSNLRVAMWSGPRNISTAMMRSWGNRADTFVCDEPLYAHYLKETGLPHPMAAEIVARHECDWRVVAEWLTGEIPQGKSIFYQKHMAHHLLDGIDREWLGKLTHCFLIRDPREMLTSLIRKYERVGLADTGLPQQVELVEFVRKSLGRTPPILDARDVLTDPERMLRKLCDALEVEFTPAMLHWPPGLRETDGIWAVHWYDAVEKSTGFQPYKPKDEPVPPAHEPLRDACMRAYERLYALRLA